MNILLTHGYFLNDDIRERRIMRPYPPLGILSIAASLRLQGTHVEVFDTTFSTKQAFFDHLRNKKPDVVGIYCNLMTKLVVLEMIAWCRQQGCTVILGGPEPAPNANEFLQYGADVVVNGEGEETTGELLEALELHGPHRLQHVRGIVFKDEQGVVVRTEPRPFINELDHQPLPARDMIDMEKYLQTWQQHHGVRSLSLVTARGCPYTCTWCSHSVYGFSYRRRSPQHVVSEILTLRDRYRPDLLWFADDVFTIHHRWIREFHSALSTKGIKIPFECISRADRLDEEILQVLSSLGCKRIWIGSESGSQRILDAMQRGVTTEQIRRITPAAQKLGIEVGLFVMLGYQGETSGDIEETINHLKLTRADHVLTTVAYPIKGTKYHEVVNGSTEYDRPWNARTDREAHVRGRLSKTFYWFAHRRLLNEVRRDTIARNGRALFEQMLVSAKCAVARWGMRLTRNWTS